MDTATRIRERQMIIRGWVLPLGAWLAQLQLSYMLVPWACAHRWSGPLALVIAGTAALVAVTGIAAWRWWRGAGGGWSDESSDARARAAFLGLVGVALNVLVMLVLAAQALAVAVIDPCQ